MHQIKINTPAGDSLVVIGEKVSGLSSYLPDKKLFIITDNNVRALYGSTFPVAPVITITPGEESKKLSVIEEVCRRLLESGADRNSFVLGFGGGVVCDVAGMAAAVFMRGISHGFVSTTLLSQVDASIGGKNGVNLRPYKNIIGTIHQPDFVICDPAMLSTLSDEEYLSGMGELLKNAVIRNRDLLFEISDNLKKLLERDKALLEYYVYRSVKIKAAIVRRDPREKGERRLLNFGHTFGHPIEMANSLPHGIAVMKGMMIATELSVWTGEMPLVESRLLTRLLSQLGVSNEKDLPINVMDLISKDKKSETGYLNAVLLRSIGKAVVRKIPLAEIEAFLKNRAANGG